MTVSQMRNRLGDVYTAKTWQNRVKRMPDNQVIAVYYSFLGRGKFDKKKSVKEEFHQITLEEYLSNVR